MKRIHEKRFDAYVDFTRDSRIQLFGEEVAWYENEAKNIFATIFYDRTDKDFNIILLGRDEIGRIRAFENIISITTFNEAQNRLFLKIKEIEQKGIFFFEQGNVRKKYDIFHPTAKPQNRNPYFDALDIQKGFSAAKELIQEIMPHFYDIDGNFVEQFQSQGFDARLWELYLFCYFNEECLTINRKYEAPDFLLSDGELDIGVEAVIAARKAAPKPSMTSQEFVNLISADIDRDQMSITWGSSLHSKMKHTTKKDGYHYWEYTHIKNKPFVLAVADFSETLSMTRSTTALINYLYGLTSDYEYDKNGNLHVKPQKIEKHIGTKEITSGFFFQEGSENISAIISSASATLSKFNRIGKECGFGDKGVILIREGLYHDHNPNASVPKSFKYLVGENTDETWSEGISIYHNPNALYPLPVDFFKNAANHMYEDGIIKSIIPEFHPYSSITDVIIMED